MNKTAKKGFSEGAVSQVTSDQAISQIQIYFVTANLTVGSIMAMLQFKC
jgi:hypothetical protein